MKTVELRPAYSWDCEECGCENFSRAIVPELTDEDVAQMRVNHGIEAWDEGDFQFMPTEVRCSSCGQDFTAKYFDESPGLG